MGSLSRGIWTNSRDGGFHLSRKKSISYEMSTPQQRDQLYVALPVRGSREPLLVHQGPIEPGNVRSLVDRLIVPVIPQNPSDRIDPFQGTLKRRVSDLQQKDQTFGRMADLVDGIVNTDGSPIFVVKQASPETPGFPVRLGEWLRKCQERLPSPLRKSPIGTTGSNEKLDALLEAGSNTDPTTQYKIRARV